MLSRESFVATSWQTIAHGGFWVRIHFSLQRSRFRVFILSEKDYGPDGPGYHTAFRSRWLKTFKGAVDSANRWLDKEAPDA